MKTFLLREFDETLDLFEKDISDPIGGSYDIYLNCRDQIEQGIASLLRFLERSEAAPAAVNKSAMIALGADHGGFELKQSLKQHLEQRGVTVADFGANSKDSTDYPDFAHAVARSVGLPQTEMGWFVCKTRIGMSTRR